ncbi:MAG: formylglycine-generating enzyme family protein [Myxococcales bacterium]|nr:formylglycine-generating enzyme family protein [Myxococcales bacterium]
MTAPAPPQRLGARDDWAPPAIAPREVVDAAPFATGEDAYGTWLRVPVGALRMRMRWIPPGEFPMGLTREQVEVDNLVYEGTCRRVTLTRGLWLGETQCTQALWQAVTGFNPSSGGKGTSAVDGVTWRRSQAFLRRINARVPGLRARLPTEAEWERACRGGTETPRYADDYQALAWNGTNCRDEPQPVARKLANPWGLYDMLGNVDELCSDHFAPLPAGPLRDPKGPARGEARVLRGGCYIDQYAWFVHAASRSALASRDLGTSVGLRLARDADA